MVGRCLLLALSAAGASSYAFYGLLNSELSGVIEMTRHARRIDGNQPEIVKAFRDDGAEVEVIHEPVDLKVWADSTRKKFMFVEVKNLSTAYGRKGPNAKQIEDMAGHPWVTITDVPGALGALRVLRA